LYLDCAKVEVDVNTGQRISGKSSVAAGRRDGRWVLAIVILALAVRVVYLLQAREHLFFNDFSDSLYYHKWAQDIVRGQPGNTSGR
jgi:hypothetical protein